MNLIELKKIKSAIVVSSDQNLFDNISEIKKIIKNYEICIINGNITKNTSDEKELKYRFDLLSDLCKSEKIIYNIGSFDLKISLTSQATRDWIKGKNNVINLITSKGYSFIILDGGVSKSILKKDELHNNIEASFINDISWHKEYDGSIGYVIANKPVSSKPKFYNYSCSLGITNKICIQEIFENGLDKTIII